MAQRFSCSRACGIFPTRDGTSVSCFGRWILHNWATRETPPNFDVQDSPWLDPFPPPSYRFLSPLFSSPSVSVLGLSSSPSPYLENSDLQMLTSFWNLECYLNDTFLEGLSQLGFLIWTIKCSKWPQNRPLPNFLKDCKYQYHSAAAKPLQSCLTLCDPTDGSPTRLPRPWDSPGKNTGVGCHFLLQCMKVKSESEVAQSCPTCRNPMDCSLPGSSVHGIFQARVLDVCKLKVSQLDPVSALGQLHLIL